jgi:hypothetical protein
VCRTSPPMTEKAGKLPLFSSTSRIVEDMWVEAHVADLQNEPLPRQDHAMVVLGPQLYVIGGSYGGRSLNDIQTYDLRTGEWQRHVVLPQEAMVPIAGHKCGPVRPACCLLALRARACQLRGGARRDSRGDVELRGASRCVVYDGKILIVGGAMKNSTKETLQVLQLDGSTLSNLSVDGAISGTAPKARRGHSIALLDGRLYIFGGQSVKNETVYDDLAILDLRHMEWSDAWAVRGDAPGKRAGHAAWICSGSMYIIGGSSGDHEVPWHRHAVGCHARRRPLLCMVSACMCIWWTRVASLMRFRRWLVHRWAMRCIS